jgi:ornithine--oxo-acid transaminase
MNVAEQTIQISELTQNYIAQEEKHGAHNYHPLPVVIESAKGVKMIDVDGKEYYDFLSAYSAVNQGHCHPKIIAALIEQAQQLTLTSRAFHNKNLSDYTKCINHEYRRRRWRNCS